MDCSPLGSPVHGISQARILEWIPISFSKESSWLRDWTWVFCIADRLFTIWAIREALQYTSSFLFVFLPPSLSHPSLSPFSSFFSSSLPVFFSSFLQRRKLQPREVGDIGAMLYTEPWPHGRGGIWSPTSPPVVWEMPGLDRLGQLSLTAFVGNWITSKMQWHVFATSSCPLHSTAGTVPPIRFPQ